MLMTTTSSLDGRPIREYLGVVNGEAIIGANLFKDMFASIRNVVGGRAGSYERTLADARRIAMEEMEEAAQKLGANAVILGPASIGDRVVVGAGSVVLSDAPDDATMVGAPARQTS